MSFNFYACGYVKMFQESKYAVQLCCRETNVANVFPTNKCFTATAANTETNPTANAANTANTARRANTENVFHCKWSTQQSQFVPRDG